MWKEVWKVCFNEGNKDISRNRIKCVLHVQEDVIVDRMRV